jgi:cytochrome b561
MTLTTATDKPKRQNAAFKHLMALHWVMAAFILLLYITGVLVAHSSQASDLARLVSFLHQSFGMLVLMLLIARIFLLLRVVRQRYRRRSPNITVIGLQTMILHSSLYFCMGIVPISGFLLRNFIGLDTTFFGIPVPPIFTEHEYWVELARSSHFWSSYICLSFIFLHILVHWKVVRAMLKKRFFAWQKLFSKQTS